MCQISLTAKKVDCIFEIPLNLLIIVGYLLFSTVVDSRRKLSQAKETI